MQAPYSMSAQHFMPDSGGQPHNNQQQQKQDVSSVYQQAPVPSQLHSTPHYR